MIRALLVFAVLFAIIWAGIDIFRSLTNKERWKLTKIVGYSTIIAVVTVVLLSLFVILF